jgi:DNA excision repair protein ERCC-4
VHIRRPCTDRDFSFARREKMYKDGGLFSVTSRILIVDMLKKTIPVHLITGLVVMHAEE